MLAIALALALAQPYPNDMPPPLRALGVNARRGVPPFFEFATPSGLGMTGPCTGAAPTGTLGEPMTFTRASGATCLKSASQTTGIHPGDMVSLATDQPRVVAGPAGYQMLQREIAGDNTVWWGEGFDHVALWAKVGVGAAAPTVTADQAQGPDGGMLMDRIQSAATTAAQVSTVEEVGGLLTSTLVAESVFVEGVSTGCTTDLCARTAAATYVCSDCVVPAFGSISRCEKPGITTTTSGDFILGNASLYNGGTVRSACDFYAVGAQGEASQGMVTSYMPTTGSADGTRAIEVADLPVALSGLTALSMGVSFVPNSYVFHAGGTAVPMVLGSGTLGDTTAPSTYVWLYAATAGGRVAIDTSGVASGGAASIDLFYADLDAGSSIVSAAMDHTGTLINECQEGVCAAASGQAGVASTLGTPTFTRLILGRESGAATNGFSGLIGNVCVDRTASRCLPTPPTGTTLAIGDSTCYGNCSTPQSLPVQLSRLLGRTVVNAGVGGHTVDQCVADWESTYRHGGYHTLIWICSVNSIAAGDTGVSVATRAEVAWAEAIDVGMHVMATGIGPWANSSSWTSGKDTEGRNYNSKASDWLLDAGQQFVSFDSLGTGNPLVLKAPFDSCADKLHPGISGVALEAYLLFDAGVPP